MKKVEKKKKSSRKFYNAIVNKRGMGIYDDLEKMYESDRYIKYPREEHAFSSIKAALKFAIKCYQKQFRRPYSISDMPTSDNLRLNWFYYLQD